MHTGLGMFAQFPTKSIDCVGSLEYPIPSFHGRVEKDTESLKNGFVVFSFEGHPFGDGV